MQELIFNAVSQCVDGKTMLILIGLFIIYRKINVLECGLRAGLLAHITRIHAGATKNGYISKDSLIIVSECYARYKQCNGDGFADNIMAEIKALPIR